ncbi:hypothetical protein M4R22_17050 [Acidovorax sp. GBBC 3334]|uniref:uracil-DNA glycosylase family protein n=1 Tax=Acidovorax sp. GBBC 3334 TaxID=2940496 RepID=UPI0023029E6F|nr:uracil-DNA glycosylase family protein [Acidovorax sp. GBBC 3334]MDA8456472.1 hypothetical protein [Acidovorax sp. GBBC 3334]
MSLDLDPRQRAMLAEMGITVWQPATEPAPAATAPAAIAAGGAATGAPAAHLPPAQPRAPLVPAAARAAPVPAQPAAPAVPRTPDAGAGPALRLHAPQPLYPQADPAATPAELGAGWLVVAESAAPDAPLTGDAGKLLENMLRAMRLHRHPRTFFAAVERATPGPAEAAAADVADALQAAIAALRPSMVLVLGLSAARAVLGSREPLGRLRATAHQLPDGTPAVVTYDPAYLLRAPDAKAAAWSDLCRALARVRSGGAPTTPAAPSGH